MDFFYRNDLPEICRTTDFMGFFWKRFWRPVKSRYQGSGVLKNGWGRVFGAGAGSLDFFQEHTLCVLGISHLIILEELGTLHLEHTDL